MLACGAQPTKLGRALSNRSRARHVTTLAGGAAVSLKRGAPPPKTEEHNSQLPSRPPLPCPLFFLNDPATTEIYPLSLPDALPILRQKPLHLTEQSFSAKEIKHARLRRPADQARESAFKSFESSTRNDIGRWRRDILESRRHLP